MPKALAGIAVKKGLELLDAAGFYFFLVKDGPPNLRKIGGGRGHVSPHFSGSQNGWFGGAFCARSGLGVRSVGPVGDFFGSWILHVFFDPSSLELGVGWVWMAIDGVGKQSHIRP